MQLSAGPWLQNNPLFLPRHPSLVLQPLISSQVAGQAAAGQEEGRVKGKIEGFVWCCKWWGIPHNFPIPSLHGREPHIVHCFMPAILIFFLYSLSYCNLVFYMQFKMKTSNISKNFGKFLHLKCVECLRFVLISFLVPHSIFYSGVKEDTIYVHSWLSFKPAKFVLLLIGSKIYIEK